MKQLGKLLYGHVEDQPAFAVVSMLIGLLALSLQDALGKILSSHLSLWQFQSSRALLNVLFVLLLARLTMRGFHLIPHNKLAVFFRSLMHVGAMMCFFGSAPFLTMAEIAGGLYTFPLFVAVLGAVVLKENVGVRRIVAILVGFAGTLLILRPGTDSFRLVALLPVGAGFCYAIFIVITRRFCKAESPVVLTLFSNVLIFCSGCLGMLTLTLLQPPDRMVDQFPFILSPWLPMLSWMVLLVIVCTIFNVIGNITMSKAYQSAESSFLAPFDYSYLVFASFWGFVFWRDVPEALTLVGMVMIAASGIFVAWRERRLMRVES